MTYTVRSVPSSMIDRLWPFAEPFVKRALDHTGDEFTADNLRDLCKEDTLKLLLVFDGTRICAAATCELIIYPNKRRLRVFTLGGSKFDEWMPELDAALANIAREFECNGVEAFVRKGFVPKLAKWNYKQSHVMVVKELAA